MIIAVALAFVAGTQVSRANSMHMLHASQHSTAVANAMGSEYLIPDSAARMMAFHQALNR
jgi:hypothetical protein